MEKRIKLILDEFVRECSKKLDLFGIIQFGSSTYSKKPKDIDLMFISNHYVKPTKEILLMMKLIKDFESRYEEVVFDFGGILDRKRKAKYSITAVFLEKGLLSLKHNPNDIFFFKSLKLDRFKKVLYGRDPFKSIDFNLTNQHLFEMLSIDLTHSLRKCLDDEPYKFEAVYHLFKTYLRGMLIHEGHFKKEELLEEFKKKFGEKIKIPKNSKNILAHNLKVGDFKDILKFTEDCLNYLAK